MAGNEVMEWWQNATPEQKAERRAVMAAERKMREAKAAFEQATWRVDAVKAMTTEGLQKAVEEDKAQPGGPHPRVARELLRVEGVERRERCVSEGSTRQNLMGGRFSEQVNAAVNDMLRMVAAGTEDTEMYAERVAREDRERQNAQREARFAVAAMTVARESGQPRQG